MEKKGVNGCGCGSGLLKYFKPPYAKLFEGCCNAHDAAYDDGGKEEDRKSADRWLFNRMLQTTYYNSFKPGKITWMVLIALMYYISVRAFGWRYFNYQKD